MNHSGFSRIVWVSSFNQLTLVQDSGSSRFRYNLGVRARMSCASVLSRWQGLLQRLQKAFVQILHTQQECHAAEPLRESHLLWSASVPCDRVFGGSMAVWCHGHNEAQHGEGTWCRACALPWGCVRHLGVEAFKGVRLRRWSSTLAPSASCLVLLFFFHFRARTPIVGGRRLLRGNADIYSRLRHDAGSS